MRWDDLFRDMELQLAAAQAQDRAVDVADLTRAERTTVLLADRFRSALGVQVGLVLRDGSRVVGEVCDAGPVWVLLVDGAREHLVPLGSLVTASGLPHGAAPPAGSAMSRLGLGHALRAVARDRTVVRVVTEVEVVVGRIDAVGGDHVDLSLAHPDSARPTGECRVVAWSALVLVSSL